LETNSNGLGGTKYLRRKLHFLTRGRSTKVTDFEKHLERAHGRGKKRAVCRTFGEAVVFSASWTETMGAKKAIAAGGFGRGNRKKRREIGRTRNLFEKGRGGKNDG